MWLFNLICKIGNEGSSPSSTLCNYKNVVFDFGTERALLTGFRHASRVIFIYIYKHGVRVSNIKEHTYIF